MKFTIKFTKERDTKNMVRFNEQVAPGETPKIGALYINKAEAGDATEVTVTVEGK